MRLSPAPCPLPAQTQQQQQHSETEHTTEPTHHRAHTAHNCAAHNNLSTKTIVATRLGCRFFSCLPAGHCTCFLLSRTQSHRTKEITCDCPLPSASTDT